MPNLLNVLNQSSLTAIIAAGLTMTLVVGQFDLCIGYTASFAGLIVVGLIAQNGLPIVAALRAGAAGRHGIGTINGLLVTKARINAVIATLGVGTSTHRLRLRLDSRFPIAEGVPASFHEHLARQGADNGIPNPILITALVLAVLWVILNKTDLGQKMQAVGGNTKAARLSGVRVDRVKIFAFATAGLVRRADRSPAVLAAGQRHPRRRRRLPARRVRRGLPGLRHAA